MPPSRPARTAALLLLCLPALAGAADPVVNLPRLEYRGGRVLARVRVVPVLWGPAVFPEARAGLGPFYRDVVQSSLYDFLGEYDTTFDGGTQQRIGPGTATDPVTLSPMNLASLLKEGDVARELQAQLAAGRLPAPDLETVYMVHFPPGVQLQQGSSLDCSDPLAGAFCAYHASMTVGGVQLLFGAIPDLSEGPCSSRCLAGLRPFDALTSIASHELIEAVTDPVPGASWYDPQRRDGVSPHSEIADICELPYGAEPQLLGPLGPTWVVQREWSNRFQACLVSRDDVFPVTGVPEELVVAPGETGVLELGVGAPGSGLDQDVQVVVAGLPEGQDLRPTVSPFLLRAGQTARLELEVGPQVPVDTFPLELLFVGPRAVLFRALTLVVTVDARPLTLSPAAVALGDAGSADLLVGGDHLPGVDGGAALALAAERLPPGLTATFEPPTLTEGRPSRLTLTRLPGAPPARGAGFLVVARGEGVRRTGAGTVDAEGDDFTVALDAATIEVAQGASTRVPVRTTASGTPRRLALSLDQLPPDTVGVFDPETVLAGESSTLTLVAGAAAPVGPHTLVVRAQGPWSGQTAVGTVGIAEGGHGCGATGGGAPWLAALGLLALGRRRGATGALALALGVAVPVAARAQALVPHVAYVGGPVLSRVTVYAVHWGPGVDPALQAQLGPFLQAALDGPAMDWLAEYGTSRPSVDGVPGTGQAIGRGRFAGAVTLTPSNTSPTLFIPDVEDELLAQVKDGGLPAPGADTLYLVYLPPTVTWEGNDARCSQLCGTRRYFQREGVLVTYAVIPDCARACGGPGPDLDNFTTLTWFEVVRSVTDPRRELGTVGRPHGWLDPELGDIGLICEGPEAVGTLGTADGGSWAVHRAWSNAAGACLVDQASGFSASVAPAVLSAVRGGAAQATVTVSLPGAGPPRPVTLDAAGVPFDATVTFSPSLLLTGEHATLTVQTSATSAASFDFTVRVHGPNALAYAQATVTTSPADFAATLAPLALTLAPGGQASAVVHAEATLGPSQPLTPSVTGLPPGVSASFEPPTLETGGSTTLTLTAAADAQASVGPYLVTVTGPGGRRTLTGGLEVSGAELGLRLGSPSVAVRAGGQAQLAVNTSRVAGTAGALSLAAAGLPAGVAATFAPAHLEAGGSAALTLSASADAAPGLSVVEVSASGGSGQAVAHLVLEVRPPGCEAAGGGPLALLGLLLAAARRRARPGSPRYPGFPASRPSACSSRSSSPTVTSS